MQTKQKEKQSDNHYLSSLDFESQKKNYHKRLKLHHIKAQQLNVPMQGKGQIKIYLKYSYIMLTKFRDLARQ